MPFHPSQFLASAALAWCSSMSAAELPIMTGAGAVLDEREAAVTLRLADGTPISALGACSSVSLVLDGIRSASEPGVVWSVYLVRPGEVTRPDGSHSGYLGDLNFFGTNRRGPPGRKISFTVDVKLLALVDTGQPRPSLDLKLVPSGRPAKGSKPAFALAALWCE